MAETFRQQTDKWDERVEGGELSEQAERPFDAGLHLAAADALDAYGAMVRGEVGNARLVADAMNGLRETLEAVIEQSYDDDEEDEA